MNEIINPEEIFGKLFRFRSIEELNQILDSKDQNSADILELANACHENTFGWMFGNESSFDNDEEIINTLFCTVLDVNEKNIIQMIVDLNVLMIENEELKNSLELAEQHTTDFSGRGVVEIEEDVPHEISSMIYDCIEDDSGICDIVRTE